MIKMTYNIDRIVAKILLSFAVVLFSVDALGVTKADADALYEKEDYAEAASAYESILKTKGVSSALYYNLGNCYYKLDDIPHAVLNYERATLLDPGDNDIRANLALARGKTIDKVVPPSEMFFVTWWRNLTTSISLDTWSYVGIAAFVVMLIGVCLYMFVSQLTVRKIGIYGAMLMFVVCIIANLCAFSQSMDIKHRGTGIIMSPSVTVKSSPSDKSTDLFLIHEGSKVEILDGSMKEWKEVKFEEGKQGWIPSEAMEVI